MKILLVVDGSDIDQRAIKRVIGLEVALAKPPQVILSNVDFSLPQRIAITMGAQGVARYHAEKAQAICGKARRMLHRAMVALKEEVRVGDVVDMALKVAKSREPT